MWNEKSSCSATAASGEAIATTSSTIPSAKSAIRQPGPAGRVGERPRSHAVGDRDERDRRELERGERPAREQGRLVHDQTVRQARRGVRLRPDPCLSPGSGFSLTLCLAT